MRAQHVLVMALMAAAVCIADSSAISREKKKAIPSIWKKLQNMPQEQLQSSIWTLLEKSQKNALDDQIIAIIEGCIANPALDPMEIAYINIAIHEDFANFTGHMDTVTLDGISSLIIDKIHIGLLTMKVEFAFTMPYLSLHGNYDLDGVFAGLLPIYGKGPFELSVTNFTAKGVINAKLSSGPIQIKSMTIDLDLQSFLFDFKYLLGSEELSDVVNAIINDMGMVFLKKYKLSIQNAVSETMTTAFNAAGITIGDITGGGEGGGPSFCSPESKSSYLH